VRLALMPRLDRVDPRADDGVTTIEYALIAALVLFVIIVAVRAVGTETSKPFSNVAAQLTTANH
jgi:Flp pilus assembly pilin Flp